MARMRVDHHLVVLLIYTWTSTRPIHARKATMQSLEHLRAFTTLYNDKICASCAVLYPLLRMNSYSCCTRGRGLSDTNQDKTARIRLSRLLPTKNIPSLCLSTPIVNRSIRSINTKQDSLERWQICLRNLFQAVT